MIDGGERLAGNLDMHRPKMIPFVLEEDTSLVVLVESGSKSLTCLSLLACDAAQQKGIPELSMADHDLEQVVKETMGY